MKFAVTIVVLALALGIEASTVAWGPWGHSAYAPAWGVGGAWDGRALSSSWNDGSWAGHGALNDGQWHEGVWGDRSAWGGNGAWAGHGAWAAPAVVTAHAAVVPAVSGAWGHEGSYVAKTRGAVHVAPLAGHAHSAASINVHPAPGTV
ncbi:adult cuticle protein 1-like [Hermetia illucens]|uniref:adult cuticle protein 1-like n=1 Tax=Hermetia illucens TaxID=343691 RepID=UPI0018CC3D13|nr:adult cuticle protein 1-like [Hermetia illucens]